MADRDVVDVLLDHLTDAVRENERQRIVGRLRAIYGNGLQTPIVLETVIQLVENE